MIPEAVIQIKPYLFQFIKASFGSNPLLDSKNFLSPIIYSHLEVPNYIEEESIVHQSKSIYQLHLRLDTCHGINIFKYNYIDPCHFTEIENKIAELIFWPFFHTYILSYLAREEDHTIKDGILQFIEEYELIDFIDYDTLKKRFYRFRQFFIPKHIPDSPGYQTSLF